MKRERERESRDFMVLLYEIRTRSICVRKVLKIKNFRNFQNFRFHSLRERESERERERERERVEIFISHKILFYRVIESDRVIILTERERESREFSKSKRKNVKNVNFDSKRDFSFERERE